MLGKHETSPELALRTPPDPDPWSVEYRAVMDDGATLTWTETFEWQSSDKERAAGGVLLMQKWGQYAQIIDGKLYPPHRLHEVTWTVL